MISFLMRMIQFLPEWMIYGNGRQTSGFLLDWEKYLFNHEVHEHEEFLTELYVLNVFHGYEIILMMICSNLVGSGCAGLGG